MKNLYLLLVAFFALKAQSQTNYAANFNGSSHIDLGNSPDLNTNTIRTMECWAKFNNFTGQQEIMAKSIVGQGLEMLVYANTLSVYCMYNGSNYSFISYPTSNLQANVWYHLAFTWDGTKESMRLYVNGVQVGSRTDGGNINLTGLSNAASSFRIGNWTDPSTRYFSGAIDEARIWNVSRTAIDIKRNMLTVPANTAGLVACYKMDAGAGSSVASSTATANITGTFAGTPSWVASPVVKNANAIRLDGTDDLVNLGSDASLKFSTNFTVELRAFSTNWAVAAEAELLSCFESGGYGISLTPDGKLNFLLRANSSSPYVGASYPVSNLANNTWYHIAGTFDGRYIRLYVDGSLVNTYDFGGSGRTVYYSAANYPVFLGADPTAAGASQGYHFAGQLDEVRFWNTVRSGADLQSNMNREIDPTLQSGLGSYYTFNAGLAGGSNAGFTTVIDQKGSNNATMQNFTLSASTSNFVTQQASLFALPVKWQSFSAQKQNGAVLLQWATAAEQATDFFTVQHSRDGESWQAIGRQSAAGNSTSQRRYAFVHQHPANGLNFYRIQENDADGRHSFSSIQSIAMEEKGGKFSLQTNTISNGRVQVQAQTSLTISVFSRDGKMQLQKTCPAGNSVVEMGGYAKGIYLITDGQTTQQFILQ